MFVVKTRTAGRRLIHIGTTIALSISGPVLWAGCATQVGIAASPSEIYVEVGGTATVNVVAVMDIGAPTAVTTPLTISSSDEAVAVVSGQEVTGVAEGTVILAISDGVFSTTADVHVVAAGTLPGELAITPTSISCTPASENTQLEVFAVFADGIGEDVTELATYSSSDPSVTLVTAEGVVVCVGEGDASVAAQHLGASTSIEVVVGRVPPLEVRFSSSTLTCAAGESRLVQVLASWEDGSTTDVSLSAVYS